MLKATQLFSIAFCTVVLSCGCAGVTRLPARAKGPAGEGLPEKAPDLSILDAPGARREDVVKSIAPVDTGYQNPKLLWARWSDSKWGYWWIVAANTGAAGDAGRFWHVHNLLVNFAEDGSVRSKKAFEDGPPFWTELHAELADAPPLNFSEPILLPVHGSHDLHSVTLTKADIQFERYSKKNSSLRISSGDIVRFSHARANKRLFPGATCHTLHFAAATSWGKRLLVCAAPSEVATLFQYLQQQGPPALRWD